MPARPLLLLAAVCAAPAAAADPLPARIDAIIDAKAKADAVPLAAPADDAEFLRRVWLDLAGTVPPAATVKAVLDDKAADKRAKAIDQLLAAPTYAARMTDLFHVMFMERMGDNPEWAAYLKASFAANKPFDAMAKEMLKADPADGPGHGASFFLSKRLENYGQNPVDYSALTRDVGRLFLGKNFQCCECHDHLFIEDYKQQDFQGLHTFFKNTVLVNAAKMQVGEKPLTEKTTFASVFTKVSMTTGPALPGGMMIDFTLAPKPDAKAARVKPDPTARPTPSTLAAAADQLAKPANRDFVRNAVNRLWFALMGRGLVHPLDLAHARNPASHPELLELLADEFVAHKFDVKWLLRELALTKTYQRSGRLPAGLKAEDAPKPQYFAVALEKRLSAEQLLLATAAAAGADAKAADGLRAKFVKAHANQPREPEDEITPSLKAALFVLHDEAVLGLLAPADGNLVGRLAKLDNLDTVAEELYLAVLSRRPAAEEKALVAKVVGKHPGAKADAIGRVAWALLASMEFGVNH